MLLCGIISLRDVLDGQVWSMDAQPYNLEVTAVNIEMPDSTTSEGLWSPFLKDSELLWWHKRDLHNIRQVVIMYDILLFI